MGVITDILKQFPLSAVLRERLIDQEKKMAALEAENVELKAENAVLKAENVNLRLQLQHIQEKKAVQGDPCPYCQQNKGKLVDIVPHPVFGDVGVKIGNYECSGCGKKYEKERDPKEPG